MRCFEAGALASGREARAIKERPVYADMRHDAALTTLYAREPRRRSAARSAASPASSADITRFSTDMGNVSYVTPSIHPILGIDSAPAVNHQPEFTAATVSPAGDQAILDGARRPRLDRDRRRTIGSAQRLLSARARASRICGRRSRSGPIRARRSMTGIAAAQTRSSADQHDCDQPSVSRSEARDASRTAITIDASSV